MKKLKFEHDLANAIRTGEKTSTWRMYDDKHIAVNDVVELIDTVIPSEPDSWVTIGTALVESVHEKRLGAITPNDYAGHETYQSNDDMLTTFKRHYGSRVTLYTPIKVVRFRLIGDADVGDDKDTTVVSTEVKLYSDGGSRGNPGPSASGYVLLDMDDAIISQGGVYLGITTNNQAEYQGLKLGLEEALRRGAREVHAYLDSMLVVNQMLGIFNVKNRDLWPIHGTVKVLVAKFAHVSFTHVPRELNKLADKEVNDVLNAHVTT